MADGRAALAAQIARLRALPKAMTQDAAPAVAVELERELVAQIGRAEGPDGKPWPLTKGGGRALQGAARDLTVRAIGDVVLARLDGVHARHHLGAVRGAVRRPILPSGRLPDPMTRAVKHVLEQRFALHMRAS